MSKHTRLLGLAATGVALIVAMVGCDGLNIGAVDTDIDPVLNDFATHPLVLDPVTATITGYHRHQSVNEEGQPAGDSVLLDESLGDYSAQGIQERVAYYKGVAAKLATVEGDGAVPKRESLKADRWINHKVVENRIGRALFRLEQEQPFANNPNFYVDLLGRAVSSGLTMEYASANDRLTHIVSRLEKTPALLDQAKANLTGSSQLQINSAKEGVDGLISMIRNDVPQQLPADSNPGFASAADGAVSALEGFKAFLDGDLSASGDWRLGSSLFEKKLGVLTGQQVSLDDVLSQVQADYDDTYSKLIATAQPIHRKIYGGQRAPSDFALMRDILDVVSDENRLRDGSGLVGKIEEGIADARTFMQSEEVVQFPSAALHVSETPSFLRSANPVFAFQGPPVLDPTKAANYWITPIPVNWSRNQTLAKLREYNNFKLKIVAIDGVARYLQSTLSSAVPDETSRLLRNVDPNRGYTNGWVWYLVDSTMGLGYQAGAGEFMLNWYKYKLEFLASVMLDIKIHTQNLSESDAQTMLERQVFMESGAVASALEKIQLTPTEFTVTYVGSKEWQRVREAYQEDTTDFSYQSFHGKALESGPMPGDELVYSTVQMHGKSQ